MWQLNPLPAPKQAANRPGSDFKLLRDPQTFDPKNLVLTRRGHYQVSTQVTRDFCVGKKILQFHCIWHANWSKSVPRTPMAQNKLRTNLIGIKNFPTQDFRKA